jgi:HK97 family phage major capsid protein
MTLKQMKQKALDLENALKDLRVKSLEGMNDADSKSHAEAITTKTSELTKITDEIISETKALKEDDRRKKALEEAEGLMEVETKAHDLQPAEAKDAAVEDKEHRKAFDTYLTKGAKSLHDRQRDAFCVDANSKSSAWKDASGGIKAPKFFTDFVTKAIPMVSSGSSQYTVPQEFQQLIQTPLPKPSVYDMIRVVPSKTGTLTWPKLVQSDTNEFGSIAVSWTAQEGSAKSETELSFEQIQISTRECNAYTEVSHSLLSRSAIDLEALLADMFRQRIRYELDRVILQGDGTNSPTGVLGFAGIHKIGRNTINKFLWQDAVALEGALEPQHLPGGVYVINNKALNGYKLQVDSQQRPIAVDNVSVGNYPTINGYPYVSTSQLPTVGKVGDVLFGNFRDGYIGVMEQDVVIRRSDDYKFRNNCAAFAMYMLFGGRPVDGRLFSDLAATTSGS